MKLLTLLNNLHAVCMDAVERNQQYFSENAFMLQDDYCIFAPFKIIFYSLSLLL